MSPKHDVTKFGATLDNCNALFRQYYENSSVEFLRRQANKDVHNLEKITILLASFQIKSISGRINTK